MIFSRRKKRDRDDGIAEAERAVKTSVDDLHTAVMEAPEVSRVVREHRRIQHRNHFAETIRDLYQGGAPA